MHIIPLPLGGDGAGNGEDDLSSILKNLEVDPAGAEGLGHELAKLRTGAIRSPPNRRVVSSCCNMGTAANNSYTQSH